MDIKKDHSIGEGTGAVAGAIAGAAVGSMAGPVGTLVGAVAGGEIELHESVDRLGGRIDDVENPLVGPHLELLSLIHI